MNLRTANFKNLGITIPPELSLDNLDVSKLLAINVDNLEETCEHQPTLQCSIGLYAREAERQLAKVRSQMEMFSSTFKRTAKVDLHLGRKVTKADVDDELRACPEFMVLVEREQELEHAAGVLQTFEEAFKQRYGMVQQIAKRRSNELANLYHTESRVLKSKPSSA